SYGSLAPRLAFTGIAAREATCTYARSRVVMSVQTARPTASPSCESCPRRTGGVHGRAVDTSHGVGLRADVAADSEVGGRGSRRTAPMELVYSAGWLTPASGQPAAASLADTRRMSASVASRITDARSEGRDLIVGSCRRPDGD